MQYLENRYAKAGDPFVIVNRANPEDPGSSFEASTAFPADCFSSEKDYAPLLKDLRKIENDINEGAYTAEAIPEDYSKQLGLKTTRLNRVFAIFLFKLAPAVTQEFYREFSLLLGLYRKALNEVGWEKL